MALSDYLTSDEWDGCFYRFASGKGQQDLGVVMRTVIQALLDKGYSFKGLDKDGNKYQIIHNTNNADKLVAAIFGTGKVDFRKVLINGREFIKKHVPELVTESDEIWLDIIKPTD